LDRRWLIAFSLVGALYAFPIHYWSTFHTANESIRLYFVQSLVDYRSASIDPVLERYAISNPDRVEHEGRAYLDKAPGLPLAVVPVYALLVAVGLSTEFVDLPYVYYVLQLFGVGIPALLGVWWVRALVWAWTDDDRHREPAPARAQSSDRGRGPRRGDGARGYADRGARSHAGRLHRSATPQPR
jgi:predicted membrane metal-binding protein